MKKKIQTLIAETTTRAAVLRQSLHCIPEPAGCEFATSALLRNALKELDGLTLMPPFLETDIVARLDGAGPGKYLVLRADIDALPMVSGEKSGGTEETIRHACGHDGHAAILWGAARVLSALRNHWNGTVLFVFQPGEEVRAMAADLVATGFLDNPRPDAVFALHGWPGLPENVVQTRIGTIMAAAGFFRIRLEGRSGHGSTPQNALNPLPAAGALTELLCEAAARLATREKTVLTVCRLCGGANANTIPSEAVLEGTTRYLNEEDGSLLHQKLNDAIRRVEHRFGVRGFLEYRTPYLPTVNDAEAVAWAREGLRAFDPKAAWRELSESSMASEDFACFLAKAPGAYLHLGLGEDWSSLHSTEFEFNDKVLATGISLWVGIVMGAGLRK